MKKEEKCTPVRQLISALKERGRQEKIPFLGSLARKLNRPSRIRHEVNLFSIDRNADPKRTVVVPGTVLGSGEVTKAFSVAALRFSGKAEEKIKKAGGKCMTLEKLVEDNPRGKGTTIMG